LGALHVSGQEIAWDRVLPGATPVDLPPYAFQRQRFWAEPARRGGADARRSGLVAGDHPWLTAVLTLADGQGHLLTGRLAPAEHPWLRDHAVFGSVLVPGTGLLDLALAAARTVGAGRVAELTLAQPLVLGENTPVRIQVKVGELDDGHWPLTIHSQPEATAEAASWTMHATGRLAADAQDPPRDGLAGLRDWPVAGTEPLPLDGLYERLAGQGIEYGPAFRGLTALARQGDVVYGRVVLPEAEHASAPAFGVHPALLDAALHTLAGVDTGERPEDTVPLPFAWTDVSLCAVGATELRVRLEVEPAVAGATGRRVTVLATDPAGEPVLHAAGLEIQQANAAQLRVAGPSATDHLYRVDFQPVEPPGTTPTALGTVVLGDGDRDRDRHGDGDAVATPLDAPRFTDLDTLLAAGDPPRRIVVDATGTADEPDGGTTARAATLDALAVLQRLLSEPSLAGTELVWLTRDAVAARPEDGVAALSQAPLWGLIRSVRGEVADRVLRLIDLDGGAERTAQAELLAAALTVEDEPELALRGTTLHAPRLVRANQGDGALVPPAGSGPWHLDLREKGSIDSLELVPVDDTEPLGENEVRIAVRAAGMNFRDVLNALGMVATPKLGLEFAGVVLETGSAVAHLRPGDRAMGLALGSFGTEVRGDGHLMVRLPDSLTFEQGATIPLAFLTAYYALTELGALRAGERLLVHAAAGGVGMAAVQLARHAGADVYCTASQGKWPAVRRLGVPADRIASSRDTDFERRWLAATGGAGMDVVLNSLAGEFTDASLRLLPRGGRFLEMGKTDIREAREVAAAHPGVAYSAFDLMSLEPSHLHRMFDELTHLLDLGEIRPLPYLAYDVREAPSAFRHMAQARHIGKIVLTAPAALDPHGTVLISGGTGELGRRVARRLVTGHGVRHLVLTSRQGAAAPGAAELTAELTAAGAASVRVVACDVADREQVAAAVAEAGREHPLTGVVHLAAVLDDGVVTQQTPERFDRVLAPKLSGARNLHEATRDLDLAAFVLFSSVAGTIGSPGQGNYGAANAFLDALAAHRRRRGLAGTSLAWGLWAQEGGMTAGLGDAGLARMRRQGALAMTPDEGLALFDAGLDRADAHLVPGKLDLARLRSADGERLPALLRLLVRQKPKRAGHSAQQSSALRDRLASLPGDERAAALRTFVQQEVAAVLGLPDSAEVPLDTPMRELGWDSLMAVELKNRIDRYTRIAVPSTLAYDYPTPSAIAGFLHAQFTPDEPAPEDGPPLDPAGAAQWALGRISAEQLRHSGLLDRLLELARPETQDSAVAALQSAEDLTAEEMDRALDAVLGTL
ncbi:SDR family NAD(P)-dependent oxidoreductase, partial [Streptomyces sp. NPDC006552]|uniref:SDR family NAD(P)-dependent oxidoreductase n=1 Tax=Streptomyces sp. NPDC006552 TaxID=3157179 RepID=UPI0033A35A6F